MVDFSLYSHTEVEINGYAGHFIEKRSVAESGSRIRCFVLTPGSGIRDGKHPDRGSGINIPALNFESSYFGGGVKNT